MFKKYFILSTTIILVISLTSACSPDSTYSEIDDDDEDVFNGIIQEDSTDYVWDENDAVAITLKDNASSVEGSGAEVSGNIVTITNAGDYIINGTLANGQLIVNTVDSGLVRLILDGVDITTASSSPIYIKDASKVVLILADNSNNSLTDGSSYVYDNATEEEPNATIFSKENLYIYGNGALTITSKFNDGISSKDGLVLRGGTLNITAVDDGLRGKDYLYVNGSNVKIKAGGDGMKSDKEEDISRGYITIDSGIFDIISGKDAISAESYLTINNGTFTLTSGGGSSYTVSSTSSAKGLKAIRRMAINNGSFIVSSSDDCLHANGRVTITNGTMSLSSADDGIHADSMITVEKGTITISKSYEGIESPYITINDGTVNVTASNDAINATMGTTSGGTEQNDGSYLYLNGGTLVASCTNGDGIDSNGNIVMTGGTAIVHGPSSQPEEAVDVNGSFTMKGGFFIGAGPYSNMFKSMSTASTQRNINILSSQGGGGQGGSQTSIASGTIFHIQDAEGNNIVTFKSVRSCSVLQFSSSDLKTGVTYSLYTGGTSNGTLSNGLYSGGTYSGGTFIKSFSLSTSSTTTSVSL